ncbi:hypothetical protein GCM10017752_67510 [Streptomyces roseoviridis]
MRRHRAAAGEQVQIDTTRLDVLALFDDGHLARPELTIAVDVATLSILAAVLRPSATNAVAAALPLAEMARTRPGRPGRPSCARTTPVEPPTPPAGPPGTQHTNTPTHTIGPWRFCPWARCPGPLFVPGAQSLTAWKPDVPLDHPPTHFQAFHSPTAPSPAPTPATAFGRKAPS